MNLLNLIETMQANPTAELVVTMDPGHPAYLRDSTKREKFLDGPFEQDEYQPLIDSGELVGSEEFCSVFVLATAATPPDFTEIDFSPANSARVLEIMRKNPGSFLMGDVMVCLFADDSGTEESVLLHNLNPDCFQRLAESGELVGVGQCHWTLKGDQANG